MVVGVVDGGAPLGNNALHALYAAVVRSTVLNTAGPVAVSFTPWSDMHDTNACKAC